MCRGVEQTTGTGTISPLECANWVSRCSDDTVMARDVAFSRHEFFSGRCLRDRRVEPITEEAQGAVMPIARLPDSLVHHVKCTCPRSLPVPVRFPADCVRRERRMTCGAELRQAVGDRKPIPFSESPLFTVIRDRLPRPRASVTRRSNKRQCANSPRSHPPVRASCEPCAVTMTRPIGSAVQLTAKSDWRHGKSVAGITCARNDYSDNCLETRRCTLVRGRE